jgi:hypothetical protein
MHARNARLFSFKLTSVIHVRPPLAENSIDEDGGYESPGD